MDPAGRARRRLLHQHDEDDPPPEPQGEGRVTPGASRVTSPRDDAAFDLTLGASAVNRVCASKISRMAIVFCVLRPCTHARAFCHVAFTLDTLRVTAVSGSKVTTSQAGRSTRNSPQQRKLTRSRHVQREACLPRVGKDCFALNVLCVASRFQPNVKPSHSHLPFGGNGKSVSYRMRWVWFG